MYTVIVIIVVLAAFLAWWTCRTKPADPATLLRLQEERAAAADKLNADLENLSITVEVLSKADDAQSKKVQEIVKEASAITAEINSIPGSMSGTTLDEKKKELEKNGFKVEDF